jgi:hypothetical protein
MGIIFGIIAFIIVAWFIGGSILATVTGYEACVKNKKKNPIITPEMQREMDYWNLSKKEYEKKYEKK